MISKASNIYLDEFVSVNNVLREHNEIKEKFKNPENALECTILKQWKHIVSAVRKILWTKILLSQELNKID